MIEDDLKLLEAVRDWRPPATVHPIALLTCKRYEESGFTLPSSAIEELRAILDAYDDDLKGLAEALEGLTRAVIFLTEDRKDHHSGAKLVELMRSYTHRFEPFWELVGQALANVTAHARSFLDAFTDRDRNGEKVAPFEGQPPPKGTIPLRNLAPPPRPRPYKPPRADDAGAAVDTRSRAGGKNGRS